MNPSFQILPDLPTAFAQAVLSGISSAFFLHLLRLTLLFRPFFLEDPIPSHSWCRRRVALSPGLLEGLLVLLFLLRLGLSGLAPGSAEDASGEVCWMRSWFNHALGVIKGLISLFFTNQNLTKVALSTGKRVELKESRLPCLAWGCVAQPLCKMGVGTHCFPQVHGFWVPTLCKALWIQLLRGQA